MALSMRLCMFHLRQQGLDEKIPSQDAGACTCSLLSTIASSGHSGLLGCKKLGHLIFWPRLHCVLAYNVVSMVYRVNSCDTWCNILDIHCIHNIAHSNLCNVVCYVINATVPNKDNKTCQTYNIVYTVWPVGFIYEIVNYVMCRK